MCYCKDYNDIISRSDSDSKLNSLSKEDLYSYFCNHPIIIDNGTKRLAVDKKKSGKICYMIGAKGLEIVHEEKPEHWQRKSLPESRYIYSLTPIDLICSKFLKH
ncbi:hypothetical protein FEM48_Zijuj07G0073200 [Ziziphus jujuba var. spinosa]|uniref:Uncharacterized protein n=1 Tax=Ziziphus jujuba var. spinosa TaxID=714518 RepID=A0A978V392_ZIZJJ|nr:hypothetical protein FEM48_Zijuj07G0073200 [Ziziphus jujuba var. spinosa]